MCAGSGTAGAGSHLQQKLSYFLKIISAPVEELFFILFCFFLEIMNLYFHLTGPARTRPFLEEDLAGGDEGLLAAAVDLGMLC